MSVPLTIQQLLSLKKSNKTTRPITVGPKTVIASVEKEVYPLAKKPNATNTQKIQRSSLNFSEDQRKVIEFLTASARLIQHFKQIHVLVILQSLKRENFAILEGRRWRLTAYFAKRYAQSLASNKTEHEELK